VEGTPRSHARDSSTSSDHSSLGIARNRAIDHLRRQRNTAVALETLDDISGEDGRELAERYARSHEVRSALIRPRQPPITSRWCACSAGRALFVGGEFALHHAGYPV
jgi:hypothetical protein